MQRRLGIVLLIVATLIGLGACRRDVSPRAADAPSAAVSQIAERKTNEGNTKTGSTKEDGVEAQQDGATKGYHYSPFVVKLDGGKFDTVSFKDVGLKRESTDSDDPLLEVISESLAYQLSQHTALDYKARVVYDEEILEPSSHLYCGINHLYIDVWRSASPDRWGYSLWSGCSELDNFAWKEIPNTRPESDLTEYVEPLTSSIVESLVEAAKSNCFQKSC